MQNEDKSRNYRCIKCNSIVTAKWFSPGSFEVGCNCLTIPIVPQIGQDETPNKWHVEREECCKNKEATELTVCYEEYIDYKCDECNAKYNWDGQMVKPPNITNNGDLNEKQSTL